MLSLPKTTQGKYDEAAVLLAKVVKIQEKRLGIHHPDLAGALSNIGAAQQHLVRPVTVVFHGEAFQRCQHVCGS